MGIKQGGKQQKIKEQQAGDIYRHSIFHRGKSKAENSYFLCSMEVDYLIIGQGLAGTLLSRSLLNAGKKVIVVDETNNASASRVAGGIVNPVTGKRLVRSWMIEELLPFALTMYRELEQELTMSLVQECSILDFYATDGEREIFNNKLEEEKDFLHLSADGDKWQQYFRFNYGIGEIAPCLLVDLRSLIIGWRNHLSEIGSLMEHQFSWLDCEVTATGISYKDIHAQKIICCEGVGGAQNPYFQMLPWSKDKGEALIASIPGLSRTHIVKQGISIVPWQDGLFWIGAAHDWKFTDMEPTPAFRKKVELQLDYWLKLPYTIVDHIVAQRPANMERKPFVGLHPVHDSIGIFNGMGGKGVSMCPWFANEFAAHLVNGIPLTPTADVRRFERILKR